MSRNNTDLARRAVACKGWRWMPGMLVATMVGRTERQRVLDVQGDRWQLPDNYADWVCDYPSSHEAIDPTMVPDLDDPATLGCLLSLVREAWGDDGITTSCTRCGGGTGWSVHRSSPVNGVSALVPILSESEATVLVCALEAASC